MSPMLGEARGHLPGPRPDGRIAVRPALLRGAGAAVKIPGKEDAPPKSISKSRSCEILSVSVPFQGEITYAVPAGQRESQGGACERAAVRVREQRPGSARYRSNEEEGRRKRGNVAGDLRGCRAPCGCGGRFHYGFCGSDGRRGRDR